MGEILGDDVLAMIAYEQSRISDVSLEEILSRTGNGVSGFSGKEGTTWVKLNNLHSIDCEKRLSDDVKAMISPM